MIYNKKLRKLSQKELANMTAMGIVESLADTFTLFDPINHFNRFLVLAIVILVLTVITLFTLKCILAYLHKVVKHNDREKSVFTVRLHNLQHNCNLMRRGRGVVGNAAEHWLDSRVLVSTRAFDLPFVNCCYLLCSLPSV